MCRQGPRISPCSPIRPRPWPWCRWPLDWRGWATRSSTFERDYPSIVFSLMRLRRHGREAEVHPRSRRTLRARGSARAAEPRTRLNQPEPGSISSPASAAPIEEIGVLCRETRHSGSWSMPSRRWGRSALPGPRSRRRHPLAAHGYKASAERLWRGALLLLAAGAGGGPRHHHPGLARHHVQCRSLGHARTMRAPCSRQNARRFEPGRAQFRRALRRQ